MRLALVALVLACGCPHHDIPRDHPQLTVQEVVDRMAKARDALTSFRTTSNAQMDYWLGNQRMKGDVLIMAKPGSMIRFAALSPAGDSTIVEMACNGKDFVLVDHQNNCALTGPCDRTTIARFFHVDLEPDDFVHLALGTPPVIADATGTVTWDGNKGVDRVELRGAQGVQKIAIDDGGGRWDVTECELDDASGKQVWSVVNADFKDANGHRLPGKQRFRTPAEKSDLIVEWDSREVNPQLTNNQFVLEVPPGVATCGQQPQPSRPARPSQMPHP